MKIPVTMLLLCLPAAVCIRTARADNAAAGNKPSGADDVAKFDNGDTLRGSMTGCDKAGLHWQNAYGGPPIVLTTKFLAEIKFRPHKIPAKAVQSTHDVLLVNGDVLPGVILSLDDKSLLLETWYAGKLAIPRAMIESITPSGVTYEGPTGMDGWEIGATGVGMDRNTVTARGLTFGSPASDVATAWGCKDGVLSCSDYGATIGRDLKLPSLSRVEFDLTLGINSQANIYLFSNSVKSPGLCYQFQIKSDSGTIDAALYSPDKANVRIGQTATLVVPAQLAPLQQVQPGAGVFPGGVSDANVFDKKHFDFRINKETKTVWLYVDGKLMQQYSHLDDMAEMGGSLIFEPGARNALMEISKIKVSSWDGGLDDAHSDNTGSSTDTVDVVNHGLARGKIKGIANGKVAFTSTAGGQEIPIKDIELINFASAPAGPPKTGTDEVRALLLAHGRVTMEIESWDAKRVTATSPDFGRAVFSPDAFRRLQFNPGKENTAGAAGDDGEDP